MLRTVTSSLYNFKDCIQHFKPPGFLYDKTAYLSIYPIDRLLFPNIIPNRDIIYHLYTCKNPTIPQILHPGDYNTLYNSNFCFDHPTVIFFHGFLEGTGYGSSKIIQEAYMKRGDHNLILVHAQLLAAGPWYLVATRNTRAIGRYTANFIDFLVERGLELDKLHLIGHSLGSHMAGFTGQYVKSGKVGRITGLDPAGPFFQRAGPTSRLDRSNAEFVDVIHTSTRFFGLEKPIGHADFYPNGGKDQPGCTLREIYDRKGSILEMVFCDHWRSVYYYAESITKPVSFEAKEACSWNDYCCGHTGEKTYMGFGVDRKARGRYYLKTSHCKPFSLWPRANSC